MQSFIDFIKERQQLSVFEAFNEKKIDVVVEKINSILSKHINGLIPLVGYQKTKIEKQTFMSSQYLVMGNTPKDVSMFQINWLQSDNDLHAYSIDFFRNTDYLYDGKGKSDLSVYTLGSSIIYFLPIIWTVASSKKYDLTEKKAIELGRSVYGDKVKESAYYVGAIKYHVYEDLERQQIFDIFKQSINEDDELKDYKKKKLADAQDAYAHRKDSEEAKQRSSKLLDEYNEIKKAIKGGATTLEELKLAIKKNVNLVAEIDAQQQKVQKELEEKHEDPEVVFKKMQAYIKMVTSGVNPSVILCGAPGVGKTFRVKQQLKAYDYHEGHNLFTIKGKCTARVLYSTLYNFQNKGQIVLIDDADGLVGPNAPEDCINILKGALDSTSDDEGRLVSYGVSGKILDDDGNELPKRFYYRGGIIVITNWNAGKLDTALRGRSFIQDINFTTEDILKILKDLIPKIDPDKLSMKAKTKAYDYLLEMLEKKEEMELSIRTFTICAKIYESCDGLDGFSEDDMRSMIKEQMRLQAARTKGKGGKY